MNAIANERRRLLATLLNTLAAGLVVTGVFAPAAAYFHGLNIAPSVLLHTVWPRRFSMAQRVTAL